MQLSIKNMVCNHCIRAVETIIADLRLGPAIVTLGRVELQRDELVPEETAQLITRLESNGFELIRDPQREMVEDIKREIIFLMRRSEPLEIKISEYLSSELRRDYRSLSRIFNEVEHRSIENFVIMQKIERAKELLLDGELTVSEIAYRLGYSGVAHLSRQFKSVTGLTPSDFRLYGTRIPLNQI